MRIFIHNVERHFKRTYIVHDFILKSFVFNLHFVEKLL